MKIAKMAAPVHTKGYQIAFGFNTPADLFGKELYYDAALQLPYYRVYATRNPGNNRYMFKSETDGKMYMVTQSRSKFPIVSCAVCDKKPEFVCGSCTEVGYCGKTCQESDWKSHVEECIKKD